MAEETRGDTTKIELLNGKNFQSWKYNMKIVLMGRGLWNILVGREVPPIQDADNTDKIEQFYARSDRAYSLIALSVEKSLQIHIVATTDPKEAWEILKSQFSFVSITQIVRLKRKFYAATMHENDDLMEHLTMMSTLAQELREVNKQVDSIEFATVVLGSLPSSYDNFITSLNARSAEELDWDCIKGSLIEEFLNRKEKKSSASNDALFARKDTNRNQSFGQQKFHPRGNNHENFRPETHTRQYNPNFKQYNGGGPCYKCGQGGHIARNCDRQANRSNYQRREEGNFTNCNQRKEGNFTNFNQRKEDNLVSNFKNFSIGYDDDIALATSTSNANIEKREWFIDSGASKHMTFNKDGFSEYFPYSQATEVYLGDDSIILAEGEGTVRIPLYINSERELKELKLQKVLYIPKLTKNLVSVAAMTLNGAEVYFDKERCIVLKNDKYITIGHSVNGKLYKVNTQHEYATYSSTALSCELWHYRLGHLNQGYVDKLAKGNLASGMICNNDNKNFKCESCILGKMSRASFPESRTRSTSILEIIHSDVCGPIEVESEGGNKYFLTFTDDFSKYTVVYFIQKKSEVCLKFQEYVAMMENKTGHKVKTIRSDNGGEYLSNEFTSYLKRMGISHELTNPYTPEQNGVSERYNRTVMEAARSMLYHGKIPLSFWAEAVSSAAYVRNRSPSASLQWKTPYECWFGKKTDLSHLRVFGCVSYVHVPTQLRKKLDPKSEKCIFIGYPEGTKGYKLYNLKSSRFVRSKSVVFCENDFHEFNEKIDKKKWMYLFPSADNLQAQAEPLNNEDAPDTTLVDETVDIQITNDIVNDGENPDNLPQNTNSVGETYEETFIEEIQRLGQKRNRTKSKRLIEEVNLITEYCMMSSLIAEA